MGKVGEGDDRSIKISCFNNRTTNDYSYQTVLKDHLFS